MDNVGLRDKEPDEKFCTMCGVELISTARHECKVRRAIHDEDTGELIQGLYEYIYLCEVCRADGKSSLATIDGYNRCTK
jgi:hypothetical protein